MLNYLVGSHNNSRGRQWHPTPVLLPGKSHGLRSLVGCSPWALEESDMTEWLPFHFSLSCIGEENGNPLQCSCLENPRDGGAWWAAVYGVVQSWTRLKRLSSSSSSITIQRNVLLKKISVKDLREFIQHLLCASYWVNSHEMWGVVFLIPVLQIRKQIQRVEVTCPSYSWSRKRADIQNVSDFKFVFLPLRSMDKLIFEIVFLTDFWF